MTDWAMTGTGTSMHLENYGEMLRELAEDREAIKAYVEVSANAH